MPDFGYARQAVAEPMPGMFVVNDRMPICQAIDELLLIIDYSEPAEWRGTVLYLPL